MKSILYNSKLCVCAVLSVVVFFLTLTVSNAALRGQPGGGITMEPQDAFVVPGNKLQLIAYFRPYVQDLYFGIWVNYKWDFQAASGASQTVVKSGTWHGGTPFELLIPNATAGHAGKYRITFNNTAGGDVVQSRWAIVTVGGAGTIVTPITPITTPVIPLSFTRQPQSQTVTAGASVTFSVTATGNGPLSYQWRKNGAIITGATSASYTIAAAATSSAGSYSVVVGNTAGSVTSQIATLNVNVPVPAPTITTQPQSLTRTPGQSAAFTVVASGIAPLSYQWRKSGVNLVNAGSISGAKTATLTIASVKITDAGNYTVIVSNSSGAVTSSSVLLTVNPLPEIKLSVRASGNQIVLSWSDPAVTLEEADTVTGPWKSATGSSLSPRLVTMSANRKFYRLRKSDGETSNLIHVTNMAKIPAGTFMMGSPTTEKERGSNETQHTVTLTKDFYMSKYEVTQREYLAVMGNNPSDFNGGAYGTDLNRPVEEVSWNDAMNYCAKLTALEKSAERLPVGWEYRLPTEAEWEYACRAGTSTPFHYGPDLLSGMANFHGRMEYVGGIGTVNNPSGIYLARTTAVGSYAPNAFGLYDMHGNVWEWCLDLYGAYPGGSVSDPRNGDRVVRGGGWTYVAVGCRSAARHAYFPGFKYSNFGFRPVLAPSQ